jgi:hypothetical protein
MNENATRNELEREANDARARLVETIDLLDQRRHEMLDWKLYLRRHSGQLIVATGGLAASVGVAAGVAIYRAERRDQRRREERWRAVIRLWEHPERVAVRQRRPLRTAWRVLFVSLTALVLAGMTARKVSQKRHSAPRLVARLRETARLP